MNEVAGRSKLTPGMYVQRLRALGALEYRERNTDGTWTAWWLADLAPIVEQVKRAAKGDDRKRRQLRAMLKNLKDGKYIYGAKRRQQWRRVKIDVE